MILQLAILHRIAYLYHVKRTSIVAALLIFAVYHCVSQCKTPFLPSFSERTTESIKVNWKDQNVSPVGWQLSTIQRGGKAREGIHSPILVVKSYTIPNLNPGTSYDLYLRTVCSVGDTSMWEGPYAFTSVISNTGLYPLNIPLRDNNCNSVHDTFRIENTMNGILGQNIYVNSVELIVEHGWPADLYIELVSPSGKIMTLSANHGISGSNFGIIGADASNPIIFSDEACKHISQGSPPFTGTFRPETSFDKFNDGSNATGIWKIVFCDDAETDKGILKYVRINFAPIVCKSIRDFSISNITNQSVNVNWSIPGNCGNVLIFYRPKNSPSSYSTKFTSCQVGSTTISGLLSETEYEYYLVNDCIGSFSTPSCLSVFKTSCALPSLTETFDALAICESGCAEPCDMGSSLWSNIPNDGLDFILWSGETPTPDTGPGSDQSVSGKYIFLESSTDICNTQTLAILESQCLSDNTNSSSCQMSFYYHMFGDDIGTLTLMSSLNNGMTWSTNAFISGNQGNEWKKVFVDLTNLQHHPFILRFVAAGLLGDKGDIAIDQIEFYGSKVKSLTAFYKDVDEDGYGADNQSLLLCSDQLPEGYSRLGGDCDDLNGQIHPGTPEISCNDIDENCDGVKNLTNIANPIVVATNNILNESCNGIKDGSINISIQGGNPPYAVIWSNGLTGANIQNLSAGFYQATITDQNGCGLETPFYEVKSLSNINLFIQKNEKATCNGINDGLLEVFASGGNAPYSYHWSNGLNTNAIQSLAGGSYTVTVTDLSGCKLSSPEIEVGYKKFLNTGVVFKKDVSCYGLQDGALEVATSGGTLPYTYTWNNGINNKRISNQKAGEYVVTATDNQGCKSILAAHITQSDSMQLLLTDIENIKCFGQSNGEIRMVVKGGTPPYSYFWNDGVTNSKNRFNIAYGTYAVTVTDDNGCTVHLQDLNITQPGKLEISLASVTPASCSKKADGAIEIIASGGIPEYNVSWSNGSSNNLTLDEVLPGIYTVRITDQNNCKYTLSGIILPFLNIANEVDLSVIKSNLCFKDKNGVIKAEINEGQAPFSYNWIQGIEHYTNSKQDTSFNLPSGAYVVTVTDGEGCVSQSEEITIQQIPEITFDVNFTYNACNTDSVGAIMVLIQGGALPIAYQWSNGETTKNISHLANGSYILSITDANSCKNQTQDLLIKSLSNLDVVVDTTLPTGGNSNGSIRVYPIGGIEPFEIQWSAPNLLGYQIENLSAGKYSFTITDQSSCVTTHEVDLTGSVATEEENDKNVRVLPNPFQDDFTITISENSLFNYSLFDSFGKLVLSEENTRQHKISTETLLSGLYLLFVEVNNKILVYKLVKL